MANPSYTAPIDFGFGTTVEDTEPSSIEMLTKNCGGHRDDQGNVVLSFKTNTGKGSGPQSVRIEELQDFASTLRDCAERGDGSVGEAGYVPAPIQLAKTFTLMANPGVTRNRKGEDVPAPFGGRDWYQWNSNTGNGNESKGSKPAKIPVDEIWDFLALFDTRVEQALEAARAAGILSEDEDEDEVEDAIDLG